MFKKILNSGYVQYSEGHLILKVLIVKNQEHEEELKNTIDKPTKGDGEEKYSVIYKVTHKETGRVYVGTTRSNLRKRKKDHLQKAKTGTGHLFHDAIATHGPDAFEWEQIDTAKTSNEAAEKEREYIFQYRGKEEGFNGDCGGGIKKNLYQYNQETGQLLKVHQNLSEAASAVGVDKKTISKACLGKLRTCRGFFWSYKLQDIFSHKEDNRTKRVFQFTAGGIFLRKFNSVAEASRITGIKASSIAKCSRGEYGTAGGYQWQYHE